MGVREEILQTQQNKVQLLDTEQVERQVLQKVEGDQKPEDQSTYEKQVALNQKLQKELKVLQEAITDTKITKQNKLDGVPPQGKRDKNNKKYQVTEDIQISEQVNNDPQIRLMGQRLNELKIKQKQVQNLIGLSLYEQQINNQNNHVSTSNSKKQQSQSKLALNEDLDFDRELDGNFYETEREFKIRKGLITPFANLDGLEKNIDQHWRSINQKPGISQIKQNEQQNQKWRKNPTDIIQEFRAGQEPSVKDFHFRYNNNREQWHKSGGIKQAIAKLLRRTKGQKGALDLENELKQEDQKVKGQSKRRQNLQNKINRIPKKQKTQLNRDRLNVIDDHIDTTYTNKDTENYFDSEGNQQTQGIQYEYAQNPQNASKQNKKDYLNQIQSQINQQDNQYDKRQENQIQDDLGSEQSQDWLTQSEGTSSDTSLEDEKPNVKLRNRNPRKNKQNLSQEELEVSQIQNDDFDDFIYANRLQREYRKIAREIQNKKQRQIKSQIKQENQDNNLDNEHNILQTQENENDDEDVNFEGGLGIPKKIFNQLFEHQKTGVKWLWELHNQNIGGIIGDDMGLGKTIQMIAFLAGLHCSGLYSPALIVCPATVLRQWLAEIHKWYPPLRVLIFHDMINTRNIKRSKDDIIKLLGESSECLLLTTYEQLRIHRDLLLPINWGYVVLDEGHKIRNPDAEITLVCKQVRTPHRIIMSGSPLQNKLVELWSLFDYVYPGKLGTLPVFQTEFAIPIQIGGYSNASNLQVSTAYKCAIILRDLIAPYLLRRRKTDIDLKLTKKSEQVLLCPLTDNQRQIYRSYLSSKEVQLIITKSRNVSTLAGIDILRKICNHPDLLEQGSLSSVEDYGDPKRAGKLQVCFKILQNWSNQGHKCLIFTQTQQMLNIIEKNFRQNYQSFTYARMDGSTSIATRQKLINRFNNDPGIFAFLLTTKVGGLGVNLVGADRVLLYDPDWNPATDVQARERAWRVGQKRDVTIYRLITQGTIEEKIYHRQIYKQFLSVKVFKDPRQMRFFTSKDIQDLFTLDDQSIQQSATANIFKQVQGEIKREDVQLIKDQGQEQFDNQSQEVEIQQDQIQNRLVSKLLNRGQNVTVDPGAEISNKNKRKLEKLAMQQFKKRKQNQGFDQEINQQDQNGNLDQGEGQDGIQQNKKQKVSSQTQNINQARQQQNDQNLLAVKEEDEGYISQNQNKVGTSNNIQPPMLQQANDLEREINQLVDPLSLQQNQNTENDTNTDNDKQKNDDAFILRQLFEGNEIKSAVDHTKIEGAPEEKMYLHRESQKIADRAAQNLKNSRFEMRNQNIYKPTWTGRAGFQGQQQNSQSKQKFGNTQQTINGVAGNIQKSSQAILQKIQARQNDIDNIAYQKTQINEEDEEVRIATDISNQIIQFLQHHGNQANSSQVIEHFQAVLQPNQFEMFRLMLKRVANLTRKGVIKFWTLKDEFL